MAKKIKVKMNSAGAKAVLNAPGVVADLQSRCDRIKSSADSMTPAAKGTMKNPNYVSKASWGYSRARGSVIAANPNSIRHNQKTNALLTALNSGR